MDTAMEQTYSGIDDEIDLDDRGLWYLNPYHYISAYINPDIAAPNGVLDQEAGCFYNSLLAVKHNLAKVYGDLKEQVYGLEDYDAGFFWLRLPKPSHGTTSSIEPVTSNAWLTSIRRIAVHV